MLRRSFLILFLFTSLVLTTFVNCFIHPVGEEEYDVLLLLAKGEFNKPVKERSQVEKAAVIRFWRAKGRFSADSTEKILLFDNKQVRHSKLPTFGLNI